MISVLEASRTKKNTLWLFNVAMESGPFIDGKHYDLP
jgi:hypothetical protein